MKHIKIMVLGLLGLGLLMILSYGLLYLVEKTYYGNSIAIVLFIMLGLGFAYLIGLAITHNK